MNLVIALLQRSLKPAMLAVALSPGLGITADVEKWVDQRGRVHYGDHPPPWADAKPVIVHHNVIETEPVTRPAGDIVPQVSRAPVDRAPFSSPRQRAEIQSYTELCRNNRGVDCEREARAMIDGPATVLFPGDPVIFPRPDLRPPPPLPPRAVPQKL